MTPLGQSVDAIEQLFSTRHARFCPGAHCTRQCGPNDCTCRPCPTSCPFCAARQRAAAPVRFEIQPTFEHRQLRLINDFTHQPKENK